MIDTVLNTNTSPLIPYQFPGVYQEDYDNLVAFVQAYYQWLESPGNANYYARNIYKIKDIDLTFDEFIIYFKEKYLKNIQFKTQTNIRTVIKHALDIYKSKGTERCAKLIFQLAFNKNIDFYYPSTDLFKASDGEWFKPTYLELSLSRGNNTRLYHKEVKGLFSGAIAFVDSVIVRMTNNRLQDIAYISSVTGTFQAGEKIVPTDGSMDIVDCPSLLGSLNAVQITTDGSGNNYTVGTVIEVTSSSGNNALALVTNTITQTGLVSLVFNDGGYGYFLSAQTASISYNAGSNAFTTGNNIYTYYGNGAVMGIGLLTSAANAVANVGTVTARILVGNLNNTFFTFGNVISAHINTYATNTYASNLYISNVNLTVSNLQVTNSSLDLPYYYNFFDTITQPMGTINYINATAALPIGTNVFTYWGNGSQMGAGVVIGSNPGASNTGTVVINILTGNVQNTLHTTANAAQANLAVSNSYNNTTATANFIANVDQITLTISNVVGNFISGEEVIQLWPLDYHQFDQKFGGWGNVVGITANTIVLDNLKGKFLANGIIGTTSGATANVSAASFSFGVVNTSGVFVASPYSYITSPITTATLDSTIASGTGLAISIANTLLFSETVNVNIDVLSTYANMAMNSATFGFPANPSANSNNAISSYLNYQQLTIGKYSNIFVTGTGSAFNAAPFVVIDDPMVSSYNYYNDVIGYSNAAISFQEGEVITQAATNASGLILSATANSFYVQRLSFNNNFIKTINSTTFLIGVSSGAMANVDYVDYDYMSNPMGRNAILTPVFVTGDDLLLNILVTDSGFGFVNSETVSLGANNAEGTAIVSAQGTGSGYYREKGGFLSDQKKLFDGYYWQNFSYVIISPLMIDKYQNMIKDLTHVAGTILFGSFVHNATANMNPSVQNLMVTLS